MSAGSAGRAGYRVVGLEASGLTCTAARTVAREVAADLAAQRALSFANASGFSISEESCSGCAARTQVAITYARGA
jgi:hypothetical protein